MVVYPNPAQDYLNITYKGLKEVYNILGSKVISTNDNRIDIRYLSSGIYDLKLAERHIKFIKE